ncbi:MAG: CHAT domain-containing protein [bacterium]
MNRGRGGALLSGASLYTLLTLAPSHLAPSVAPTLDAQTVALRTPSVPTARDHSATAGDLGEHLTVKIDSLEQRGEYVLAADFAWLQLDLRRRALDEDHPLIAESLDRCGVLLTLEGRSAPGVVILDHAFAMRTRILGEHHEATVASLEHLAFAEKNAGYIRASLEHYQQALRTRREHLAGDRAAIANTLIGMGNTLRNHKHHDEASAALEEAIGILAAMRDTKPLALAKARTDLALILLLLGRAADAEPHLRLALPAIETARDVGHPDRNLVYSFLGSSLLRQGRCAEAEPLLRRCAAGNELVRIRNNRGPYVPKKYNLAVYDELALTLLDLGRFDEAWRAAESGRAPALAEALIPPSMPAVLATRSDPSSVTYTDAMTRGLSKPPWADRTVSLDRVQAALPGDAALIGWLDACVVSEKPLWAWAYVVRKDRPIAWVRLPLGESAADPASTQSSFRIFNRAIQSDVAWPVPVPLGDDIVARASAIWRERIAPIEPHLEGIRHLVVLNSKEVLHFPVEAMCDPHGKWASDRFTISYAPSAASYALLRERGRERDPARVSRAIVIAEPQGEARAATLGGESTTPPRASSFASRLVPANMLASNPGNGQLAALDWAARETKTVSNLTDPLLSLTGVDATEQRLAAMNREKQLREFDRFHFIVHAIHDPRLAYRSALVLAEAAENAWARLDARAEHSAYEMSPDDGLLTAEEISTWDLEADLVTLSSCGTRGQQTVGLESWGPTEAFLLAGAQSLLVSLYRVDDHATSILMERFYSELRRIEESSRSAGRAAPPFAKATALQNAKNSLREFRDADGNQPYRHPGYWASFVLVGDPG